MNSEADRSETDIYYLARNRNRTTTWLCIDLLPVKQVVYKNGRIHYLDWDIE